MTPTNNTIEPCEKCLPIIQHHKAERDAMQSKRDAVLIALKMAEREHRLLRERIDVLENTQLQADKDCAKVEAERDELRLALRSFARRMAYNHGGGMVSGQYACLNCSARVYVGPLMPRTPFTLRKIEKLGRWVHKQ